MMLYEASPESVRPSPTSVCSVTESAGQKILRIADNIRFRTNRGPSLGMRWSLYSATGIFKTSCLHSGKILALGC